MTETPIEIVTGWLESGWKLAVVLVGFLSGIYAAARAHLMALGRLSAMEAWQKAHEEQMQPLVPRFLDVERTVRDLAGRTDTSLTNLHQELGAVSVKINKTAEDVAHIKGMLSARRREDTQ